MGTLCVSLNNINLDEVNFYEDDPKSIIHVRLLTWCNKLKQRKKEVSKELIPVEWIQQDGWIGECQTMRKTK